MKLKKVTGIAIAAFLLVATFLNVGALQASAASPKDIKTVTIEGDLSDPASYEKNLSSIVAISKQYNRWGVCPG